MPDKDSQDGPPVHSLHGTDPLSIDVKHMEGLLPQYHGEDAYEIPGARALLKEIGDHNIPWAIVTSGTVPLVTGWLKVLGLPNPEHLVTAESVQNG